MRTPWNRIPAPAEDERVTMLELFFDLVFVFIVIQLTGLIIGSAGWQGYGQAGLVLAVTWWMYLGYAWLANNVTPITTQTRLPMLAAMTCFLAMAVVVPDAFGDGAYIFGVSYLVVVTIHHVQFARSSLGDSALAIRTLVPFNYGAGALLILAAVIGERWGWVCWVMAVVLFVASMARPSDVTFALRPEHFAERHRLLIIVALGETIVAIGAGAEGHLNEPRVFAIVVLAMILICALWWIYFAVGDETAGAEALERIPAARRTTVALIAYSYTHVLHIAGLVLVAVGLHDVVHDPGHRLTWGVATTLSAGVAVFLIAQALFRNVLGIGNMWVHGVAAIGVLGGTWLGATISGGAHLVFAAIIVLASAAFLQATAPRARLEGRETRV